ncbi:MAG: aspartate carbamoyltransferase regulatory subunit [Acetivibrio ethanolgignens]
MLKVDSIEKGIVLDHIKAGKAMQIYKYLNLDALDCSVAIIKNVKSNKMGAKDIIKINENIDINLDVLGYIDPNITVIIIENNEIVDKKHLELPEKIVNVARCKNPRCITSVEQELDHVFKLVDRKNSIYRCMYCDQKASGK